MVSRSCSAFFATLVALFVALFARDARAETKTRRVGANWKASVPAVSFGARDMLTRDVIEKLQSGLPQTVITRVYVVRERGKKTLAFTPLVCRYTYDLWANHYRVEYRVAAGWQVLALNSLKNKILPCFDVSHMSVGSRETYLELGDEPFLFRVEVDFNPTSEQARARIQQWLAKGNYAQRDSDKSLLGSMVGFFLSRHLSKSERHLEFNSQVLIVPPVLTQKTTSSVRQVERGM